MLGAARPLLDPEWTASLRDELRWLGGALGPVRDLDALLEWLRAEVEHLERRERRTASGFLELLEEEREAMRAALLEAMTSDRYGTLLSRLEEAAQAPRVQNGEVSLHDIASAEFRRLRKAVRALPPEPPDEQLHAVRIRGKRARHAAELAARAVGKPARRFIRDAKRFQDVVGNHQDAVVDEERIRSLLRGTRGRYANLAAGRLIERERARRREARAAFPKAWAPPEKSGKRAWA
jgi:CHAD domain-containing protein